MKTMHMTFRWFGHNSDTVTLKQIRQVPGVEGIMGFLDYKAAGDVWSKDEIAPYINEIKENGLKCEVIESVNVHESIKLGTPDRDKYIENYIQTIKNLSTFGVKVIIYNFMPVIDWLRTDLNRIIPEDGSYSMYYDEKEIEGLSPLDMVGGMHRQGGGFSLPGWEPERMKELAGVLERYSDMDESHLLVNFKYFLDALMPTCESVGIKMSCHPDDPAWKLFGLPRRAHDFDGLKKIVALNDSPCNSLCLCTGSLASNPDNDIPAMIRHFGKMGRIGSVHIRNIKRLGYRHFRESAHFSGDGDLDMFEIVKAFYDCCPDAYIRPDHGRMIWDEKARPGYGLYDRAIGANYLLGLWEAIDRMES